jgi:hypothetical protein
MPEIASPNSNTIRDGTVAYAAAVYFLLLAAPGRLPGASL